MNIRFLTPNPENDSLLPPCPNCGSGYIPVGKRPAILMFTIEHYQVVCLNCNHRSKKAKRAKLAMSNWQKVCAEKDVALC